MEQTTLRSGKVLTHHVAYACDGNPCPLHNPSDHSLRDVPLDWHKQWGVMVRVTGLDSFEVDPDEYKIRNLNTGETYILRNSGVCRECGTELVSEFRHDFVSCPCGEFVDGGHDYARRTTGLIDTSDYYTKGQ